MTRPLSTMVDKDRRQRKSKEKIAEIRDAIVLVLEDEHPATIRNVFYRLVSSGLIDKTEEEYKTTVIRLITLMRRDGSLPWSWITDGTRWRRKPTTYTGLQDALEATRDAYRRDLWRSQDACVEIWVEKSGLVGVLDQITWGLDVSLMPCNGYPSHTFLHSAGAEIAEVGKPTFVYYFGDHDPAGVDIDRFVAKHLREYAPTADIEFERVAVTEAQIEELGLLTRPTKRKEADHRARRFRGDSVEVEAIKPSVLRELARECIVRHIDAERWEALQRVEAAELETAAKIADNWQSIVSGDGGR